MALSSMRNGIFSKIFLGVLVLGSAGLILSDWNGFFRGGVTKTDVANVNGHQIKIAEFDHILRRHLQGQNINPAEAYKAGFVDQVLQQEIISRLLRQAASDHGIAVDDKLVAKQIHTLIEPMAGKGDKKQVLQQVLQAQGMTEGDFVNAIRSDMAVQLLSQSLTSGIYIPKNLAARMGQWNGEKREVSYVTLTSDDAKDIKIDQQKLASFYDTIKSQYAEPETRDVTVAIFDPAAFSSETVVSDEEAKKYYNDHKDDYKVGERRVLEQAVLKSETEASEVLKKAKADKNLKAAVKSVTGNEKSYTGENEFDKAGLTDAIAKPVFDGNKGDLVGPVQSPLGWHVIYLKDIKEEAVQPFETVSAHIKKELEVNKSSDEVFEVTSTIEDRLAEGEDFKALQDEYKLKLISLPKLAAGEKEIEALKAYKEDESKIIAAAFSAQEGEASPLSDLSNNLMFSLRVNEVTESKSKDLKSVKSEVTEKYLMQEKRRALLVKAMQISGDLDNGKTQLEKLGKVLTASLTRDSKATAGLTADNIAQIMNSDAGKTIVLPKDNGVKIIRVAKSTFPAISASTDAKQIEASVNDWKEARFLSYVSKLQGQARIDVNRDLLDRAYGQQQDDTAE